jgi:hypothetical protein
MLVSSYRNLRSQAFIPFCDEETRIRTGESVSVPGHSLRSLCLQSLRLGDGQGQMTRDRDFSDATEKDMACS